MASLLHRKNSFRNEGVSKLDMTKLSDREASFGGFATRWPSSLPSADSMAEAGFYFSPNEKSTDCCTCYRCGVRIYNWLPDDTPKIEHKKFSPSCKEVKSWIDIPTEDDRRSINRAEQSDNIRFRHKLADKAKKITGALHRKHDIPRSSRPLPSFDESKTSNDRPLTDDEKLADIRRQREVAEKSLAGLEKLVSFYPIGSSEQKRADQQMILQAADLLKLREEEDRLVSAMGSLSFGRGWHDVTENDLESPPAAHNAASYAPSTYAPSTYAPLSADASDESPDLSRGRMRPLPQLPSQLLKNSKPARPARIVKSPSEDAGLPSYEQYEISKSTSGSSLKEQDTTEEWTEYFTDDGVPYYYNTISKLTVWQIPGQDVQPMSVTSN